MALGSKYEAIGSGHEAVARLLINTAADISAIDSGGNTPLHLAAWQGCEAVARMLIDRGADIVAADQYGMTARDVANKLGHETVVRLLIDGGATYGQSGPTAEAP
jgi:ankyrin repeat protein